MRYLIITLALLLAGCVGVPPDKTVYLRPMQGVPTGLTPLTINTCCGSMRPRLHGGELAYGEPYHGQSGLKGYIVSTDYATHFVIDEREDAIATYGVNNTFYDGWTQKSKIRYIIRYVVRT